MFMGIFLLFAGIGLGNSLVMKLNELNGEHSMDKVVVSAENRPGSQSLDSFTPLNMNDLSGILKTGDIAFSTNTVDSSLQAADSEAAAQAEITGTNYLYPEFLQINLMYGSFFTHKAEVDGEDVAVIDETLAWTLFKTLDAVGRKVEILGREFKIVGVAEKGGSIIETLTDDGIPDVYIPAARLLELEPSEAATCFQVKSAEAGLPGQYETEITNALQAIGKSPENYRITNYQTKEMLLSQIPLIVQFIPGLAAIFILVGFFLKDVRASYIFIRTEFRDKDMKTVISDNLPHICMDILKLLLLAAGVCAIWLLIRFKLYIPSEYVPDELINFAYYIYLIKSGIGGRISGMGHISPQVELIANMGGILITLATAIPAMISFVLIRSGFVRLKLLDVEPVKLTLLSALMLALSLVLTAGAASLLGLPEAFQIKSVLVLWTFIYIINIKIYNRKESEQINV